MPEMNALNYNSKSHSNGVRVDSFPRGEDIHGNAQSNYSLTRIFLPSGAATMLAKDQVASDTPHLVISCTYGVLAIREGNEIIETLRLYPGMVWERPAGSLHIGENVGTENIIILKDG